MPRNSTSRRRPTRPLFTSIYPVCLALTQGGLTPEQIKNYVLPLFLYPGEKVMIRAVVEEAAALASLALFLGMIAIWAQVISSFLTTPTL